MFSKDTFNEATLADFCKEQKAKFQEQLQIQKEADKICSDTSGQMFKQVLKNKYLDDGYSTEWIDAVLDKIVLNVLPKSRIQEPRTNNLMTSNPTRVYRPYESNRRSTHDKTKYGMLGSGPLAKRKFVWYVVSQYVKENPTKSYAEYSRILNELRPDSQGVVRPYNDLYGDKKNRYFTNVKERLTSSDGVEFVVCNQWGDFNIGPVVRFAKSQGYDVVEYRDDE